MKKMHSYRVLGLGVVFFLLALILGIAAYQLWARAQAPYVFHGTVLNQPRSMPEYVLEGSEGYPIDTQHLQGHWTFLFMGFSHCASVCPLTMAELAKMSGLLSQHSDLPMPWVVMVTLDPKRDSLDRMHDYVRSFDSHFLGARGSEEEVKKLAQYLGIAYTQVESKVKSHSQDYSIEHSGAIMLLNPNGELVAFFTPPHHAQWLVQDYQHIVKQNR